MNVGWIFGTGWYPSIQEIFWGLEWITNDLILYNSLWGGQVFISCCHLSHSKHYAWLENLRPGWRCARPGGGVCAPRMEVWMPISAPVALVIHERAWVFLFLFFCLVFNWSNKKPHFWGHSLRVRFAVSGPLTSWLLWLHLGAGTTFWQVRTERLRTMKRTHKLTSKSLWIHWWTIKPWQLLDEAEVAREAAFLCTY